MSSFRQQLAYRVVASHGLAMFILFAAPLQYFLINLGEEHLGSALLAAGAMAASFVGTLRFASPWLAVSTRKTRRSPMRQAVLRWFRIFVGNGDAIQGLARRIDPGWKNPYAGRTPQETARWLESMELIHWAALAASGAPVAAAFYYGHHTLGTVYVLANLVYNVAPNLVIRDTRGRLLHISERRRGGAPIPIASIGG